MRASPKSFVRFKTRDETPNGLMLEFTVDHQDAHLIANEMAATAHQDMRRWINGDRTPNNRWRPDGAAVR